MRTETAQDRIRAADAYLAARTGNYAMRCERYDAALEAMHGIGLAHTDTVVDVGSGWGEFGVRMHDGSLTMGEGGQLHGRFPSHARYIPVDAGNDGTDLETWIPPRVAEWFVCLEVLEHLNRPGRLVQAMKLAAAKGIVVSTPNPETTDVLGMDATHRTPIGDALLALWGFPEIREASFYGQPADSLFAVWTPR